MDFSRLERPSTSSLARPAASSLTSMTERNKIISAVYSNNNNQYDFTRHNRSGATPPPFLMMGSSGNNNNNNISRPFSAGLNLFNNNNNNNNNNGNNSFSHHHHQLPPLSSSNLSNNNNNLLRPQSAGVGVNNNNNNNNNNSNKMMQNNGGAMQRLQAATQLKIAGYIPPLISSSSFHQQSTTTTRINEETGQVEEVHTNADYSFGDGGGQPHPHHSPNSMLGSAAGTGQSVQQLRSLHQEQARLSQQLSQEERRAQEAKAADDRRRQEIDYQAVLQAYDKAKQHLSRLWGDANIPEDERQNFSSKVWSKVSNSSSNNENNTTLPGTSDSTLSNNNNNNGNASTVIAATSRTLEEIEKLLQIRDSEIKVEKSVEIRQGFLYLLQEVSDRFNTGKVDREAARKELTAIVPSLRKSTCDVVEAIEQWSGVSATKLSSSNSNNSNNNNNTNTLRQQLAMNYAWRGANYCEKMLTDTGFLGTSRIRGLLDFEPIQNPLMRGPKMFVGANRKDASTLQDRILKSAAFLNAVAEHSLQNNLLNNNSNNLAAARSSQQQQQQNNNLFQSRSALLPNPNGNNNTSGIVSAFEVAALQKSAAATGGNSKRAQQHHQSLDIIHGFGIAASRIQALFRGFQARCRFRQLRREDAAAQVIQRAARRFVARCVTGRLRARHHAAVRIQALFRGNHVRDDIRDERRRAKAATAIQSVFRGFATRKRVNVVRFVVGRATQIQKVFRGFRVRKTVESVMHHRLAYAATRIQALFRGYSVRCQPRYNHRIQPQVIRIQAVIRGCLARIHFRRMQEQLHAAVRLQAWHRGLTVRGQMRHLRLTINQRAFEALKRTEERAAVSIQRAARGFVARRRHPPSAWRRAAKDRQRESIVQLALQEELTQRELRTAATTKIQTAWRGHSARKALPLALLVVRSAVKIQALARGFLVRKTQYLAQLMQQEPEAVPFSVADLLKKYEQVRIGGRDYEENIENDNSTTTSSSNSRNTKNGVDGGNSSSSSSNHHDDDDHNNDRHYEQESLLPDHNHNNNNNDDTTTSSITMRTMMKDQQEQQEGRELMEEEFAEEEDDDEVDEHGATSFSPILHRDAHDISSSSSQKQQEQQQQQQEQYERSQLLQNEQQNDRDQIQRQETVEFSLFSICIRPDMIERNATLQSESTARTLIARQKQEHCRQTTILQEIRKFISSLQLTDEPNRRRDILQQQDENREALVLDEIKDSESLYERQRERDEALREERETLMQLEASVAQERQQQDEESLRLHNLRREEQQIEERLPVLTQKEEEEEEEERLNKLKRDESEHVEEEERLVNLRQQESEYQHKKISKISSKNENQVILDQEKQRLDDVTESFRLDDLMRREQKFHIQEPTQTHVAVSCVVESVESESNVLDQLRNGELAYQTEQKTHHNRIAARIAELKNAEIQMTNNNNSSTNNDSLSSSIIQNIDKNEQNENNNIDTFSIQPEIVIDHCDEQSSGSHDNSLNANDDDDDDDDHFEKEGTKIHRENSSGSDNNVDDDAVFNEHLPHSENQQNTEHSHQGREVVPPQQIASTSPVSNQSLESNNDVRLGDGTLSLLQTIRLQQVEEERQRILLNVECLSDHFQDESKTTSPLQQNDNNSKSPDPLLLSTTLTQNKNNNINNIIISPERLRLREEAMRREEELQEELSQTRRLQQQQQPEVNNNIIHCSPSPPNKNAKSHDDEGDDQFSSTRSVLPIPRPKYQQQQDEEPRVEIIHNNNNNYHTPTPQHQHNQIQNNNHHHHDDMNESHVVDDDGFTPSPAPQISNSTGATTATTTTRQQPHQNSDNNNNNDHQTSYETVSPLTYVPAQRIDNNTNNNDNNAATATTTTTTFPSQSLAFAWLGRLLVDAREEASRRVAAAQRIQAAYRRYNGRFMHAWMADKMRAHNERRVEAERAAMNTAAAALLQRVGRGYSLRAYLAGYVRELYDELMEQRAAAQERHVAAVAVQCAVRSYNARFHLRWLREGHRVRLLRLAQQKDEEQRQQEERERQREQEAVRDAMVAMIQRVGRGYDERFLSGWRRSELIGRAKREKKIKEDQTAYRELMRENHRNNGDDIEEGNNNNNLYYDEDEKQQSEVSPSSDDCGVSPHCHRDETSTGGVPTSSRFTTARDAVASKNEKNSARSNNTNDTNNNNAPHFKRRLSNEEENDQVQQPACWVVKQGEDEL